MGWLVKRRSILKYSCGLSILGIIGAFSIGKSLKSSSHFKVVFSLPPNMSYDQYRQSVPLWVNLNKLESILANYRNEGALLSSNEKLVGKDKIQREYYFTNDEIMYKFCRETVSSCDYDFKHRQALGIVATSYLNGSVKDFLSNITELKFAPQS